MGVARILAPFALAAALGAVLGERGAEHIAGAAVLQAAGRPGRRARSAPRTFDPDLEIFTG